MEFSTSSTHGALPPPSLGHSGPILPWAHDSPARQVPSFTGSTIGEGPHPPPQAPAGTLPGRRPSLPPQAPRVVPETKDAKAEQAALQASAGSRLDAMLERLLAVPGHKPDAAPDFQLPAAFGMLIATTPLPPGWLERVLDRITEAAAQGASPQQIGKVIALLRPASIDGRTLVQTVLGHALNHAGEIPLAGLHAWLCSAANLADRVAKPPDSLTRLAMLGPIVLAATPPLAPAVAAAVAMALFTPVATATLADNPPLRMQEVLTQLATLVAPLSEPPPAATLVGFSMGLVRSLILAGWEPPSTLATALHTVTTLAPTSRAAFERGIELARNPASCLDETAGDLALSHAERVDCLEVACVTRGLLFVSTPDSHLDAIRALKLPPAQDAVRHTLIDRATTAHPLPKTQRGLADLHRRKLAALVTRLPVSASLPTDGKSHGKGDGKQEVGGDEQVLALAQAGLAEAGRTLDMMDFYDAFRAAFPIYALLRNTLQPARREADLRELTRAQAIIEGFLTDIDRMAAALGPGLAANLRTHVQDMNDGLAAGLQALAGACTTVGAPAPKESKTKADAT